MEFEVENIYTTVTNNSTEESNIINSICNFKYSNFMYRWVCNCNATIEFQGKSPYCYRCNEIKPWNKIKKKPRPETINLNYYKDSKFPSGFLPNIIKEFKINNIPYTIKDNRTKIEPYCIESNTPDLREYQEIATKYIYKYKRGIIHIPTRGGKTYIASKILFDLGQNSIVIVPNLDLLYQTYELIQEHAIDPSVVGIIGDSKCEISKFNIATIQTLHSRQNNSEIIDMIKSTNVLIIDEAHHVKFAIKNGKCDEYNTWLNICMSIPAYYRIGMTATPGKPKSIERGLLEAATGGILYQVTLDYLVANNYVAQPHIYFYHYKHNGEVIKNFQTLDKKKIFENTDRHKFIANIIKKCVDNNETVLVLVDKIKHGNNLKKYIENSEIIVGDAKPEKRKNTIKKFENKEIKVLITTLFKEGSTINFSTLVLASSFSSEQKLTQNIGRVLNMSDGKKIGKVIDIFDLDGATLENRSKKRRTLYNREKFKLNYIKE